MKVFPLVNTNVVMVCSGWCEDGRVLTCHTVTGPALGAVVDVEVDDVEVVEADVITVENVVAVGCVVVVVAADVAVVEIVVVVVVVDVAVVVVVVDVAVVVATG